MSDTSKLRVLDAAERFAGDVIRLSQRIDRHRAPGLVEQLIRSSESVAANISEAARLGTGPNFRRQLLIALGSAEEAGTHIRVLRHADLLPLEIVLQCDGRRRVICSMIQALVRRLDEQQAHEENAKRRSKPTQDPPAAA